ncbi:MAG: four helix bundle protein [Acidobacteria bacterium]|nr:four helix bundle protein [Acidobacteriota bacterium]
MAPVLHPPTPSGSGSDCGQAARRRNNESPAIPRTAPAAQTPRATGDAGARCEQSGVALHPESAQCQIFPEGAGRHSRRDKRRHYAYARGSAMETAAAIDVLRARHLAPEAHCAQARSLALRVVQMLSKLDAALA